MAPNEAEKNNDSIKVSAAGFFDGLTDEHGYHFRSLAYGSRRTQHLKFQVLSEIGDLRNASILDVGCGFGDLFFYLRQSGIPVTYQGIDISSRIVELANRQHPQLDIQLADALIYDPGREYDYVVTTGFNCVDTGENWQTLTAVLGRMFRWCRRGVAAGMVSTFQTRRDPRTYYADPMDVLTFCKTLTPWLVMRHDYLPHDFTMYMYREQVQPGKPPVCN